MSRQPQSQDAQQASWTFQQADMLGRPGPTDAQQAMKAHYCMHCSIHCFLEGMLLHALQHALLFRRHVIACMGARIAFLKAHYCMHHSMHWFPQGN